MKHWKHFLVMCVISLGLVACSNGGDEEAEPGDGATSGDSATPGGDSSKSGGDNAKSGEDTQPGQKVAPAANQKPKQEPSTAQQDASGDTEQPKSRVFSSIGRAFLKGMAEPGQQDAETNGQSLPEDDGN